jgi:hypothetical protein
MGSLDWEVSALGFGAMRLPMKMIEIEGNPVPAVDEEESIKMIRYAIDHGVNYVDTAYPYHNGQSEVIVGKALKDGYREKVYLATKAPMWMIKKRKDFNIYLNQQIERLQTKPDLYLLHGLNKDRMKTIKELDIMPVVEEAKANGMFKHIAFSFHDDTEAFKEIIDFYDWDMAQIQYNYLDIENQAGTEGLKYAASKGIAVVVMEPIRGGKLAIPVDKQDEKPAIKKVLDDSDKKRTMADWALQFVWNHPEVSVVLSGMSNMQQVQENVKSADASGIGILTADEQKTIADLRKAYESYIIVPCTSCQYCMPCPQGVAIPNNLGFVNDLKYWGKISPRIQYFYGRMAKTEEELEQRKEAGEAEVPGSAALCTQCGECLDKCPQNIEIPDWLEKLNAIMVDKKPIKEVL